MIAIGIFGLQDPLRPGIRQSIQTCHEAGITVIMCTGDNIDTATAISKNAGIIEGKVENKYQCMTGEQFRNYVLPAHRNGKIEERDKTDDNGNTLYKKDAKGN